MKEDERETSATSPRRRVLKNAMSAAAGGVLFFCGGFGEKRANAGVMGSIAGRVPGFGKVGSDGSMWYTRPEAKSGGHGIGWTDITPYSLKLREGWEEVQGQASAVEWRDLGSLRDHQRQESVSYCECEVSGTW